MTPEKLAEIHAAAFGDTRAWSAQEFSDLLKSEACFLVHSGESFAIGRMAGPEVELLTLAVSPLTQGQGLGRDCLKKFEALACSHGVEEAFLEVAENNAVAISLYKSSNYKEIGRREGYYATENGENLDAIVLSKMLNS